MWNDWRYSEVVEFASALILDRDKDLADLEGMDLEYVEQISAAMLQLIAKKL